MLEPVLGSPENLLLAQRLYRALADGDLATLMELLTDDFVGDLSPGLPEGFGTSPYAGRDAMLRDGWGRIARLMNLGPLIDDIFATSSTIIGRGRYLGRVRTSQALLNARFAHFWTVRDGRLASVYQVTDTAAWRDALDSSVAGAS